MTDLTLAMCPSHGAPTHAPYIDHHEQIPRCPHPRCHRPLERVAVVYRDGYDELCNVAQDMHETLTALLPRHDECSCSDDETCAGCRARAVLKAYAGADW